MRYVLIELYTDDFMQLNDYRKDYNIIGVYEIEGVALQKFHNEIDFQINDDKEWSCEDSKYLKENGIIGASDLFFNGEYQYSIVLEEVRGE